MTSQPRPGSLIPARQRLAAGRMGLLAERDFRIFFAGYATSLLGSAMSAVAVIFAVLGSGGNAAELGFVSAARIVPLIVCMVGAGVLADRAGRRRVMLGADAARLAVQAALAAVLLAGRPPAWLFVTLAALLATAEAFFTPALGGLPPQLAPPGRLTDANALLSVARSATQVAGPALAGILIAVTSPAVVIAADAASYGASVLALALLRIPPQPAAAASPWRDLAEGWAGFRQLPWLRVITVQFALFNLLSWAPYLLLGPVLARDYLGGARAWGAMSAALAAGSVAGGLAMVGRRPARPLVTGAIGCLGYAAPCLALALRAPLPAAAAAAAVAGAGSAVFTTCLSAAEQRHIPVRMLSRVSAISITASYALGGSAFAVIGPLSLVIGPGRMLGFAAAWAAASAAGVLAFPSVRRLPLDPAPASLSPGGAPGPRRAGADPAGPGQEGGAMA